MAKLVILLMSIGIWGALSLQADASTLVNWRRSPGLDGAASHLPYPDGNKRVMELGSVNLDVRFEPSGWAAVSARLEARGKGKKHKIILRHPLDEMKVTWRGKSRQLSWQGTVATRIKGGSTQKRYEFASTVLSALDGGWKTLTQEMMQPLRYEAKFRSEPATYWFEYKMDQIDHWQLSSRSKLTFAFQAPKEYLEMEPSFSCELVDWYDPQQVRPLQGEMKHTQRNIVFMASMSLEFPSLLRCRLRGGPDFDEENRLAQETLRGKIEARAKKISRQTSADKLLDSDLAAIIEALDKPQSAGADDPKCEPYANEHPYNKQNLLALIRANMNQVRHCYDRILARNPTAKGKVRMQVTIGANGCASDSKVLADTVGDKILTNCIQRKMLLWSYPQPNKPTDFQFPFEFNPF